eukprot:365659_1
MSLVGLYLLCFGWLSVARRVHLGNNDCWYLAMPVGSDPVSYDYLPPNVCHGIGTDQQRTQSQIYRIINDESIQYQNFSGGECEGSPINTRWFNASDYELYASDNGRDCSFVERKWSCDGFECDETPCHPQGFFWETTGVTGHCEGARTNDPIQVVRFCDRNAWGTYRFDGGTNNGCTGAPYYNNTYRDGCFDGSPWAGNHAYYERTMSCNNYQSL